MDKDNNLILELANTLVDLPYYNLAIQENRAAQYELGYYFRNKLYSEHDKDKREKYLKESIYWY
jgi:hypothetical protein